MFAPGTVDISYSKGDRTGKPRQTHWGSLYEACVRFSRALAAENLPEQSKEAQGNEAGMDVKLCKHKDKWIGR